MQVRRIVANLAALNPAESAAFYHDLLGLEVAMDLGFIVTLAAPASTQEAQLSFACEGGSGRPVPDLSIEVDDLDAILPRLSAMGITPEYGPVSEPWNVRRLMLRDPAGRLINILCHCV
ncbi:VOC family protein [Litorivita sp. NS0012-18]|uniref:VOC family protein n=1 Tax=Litorivita sp. NS0012-18 TaxID=3127655 RepID=UPI0031079A77